jgi:hypothetical protein
MQRQFSADPAGLAHFRFLRRTGNKALGVAHLCSFPTGADRTSEEGHDKRQKSVDGSQPPYTQSHKEPPIAPICLLQNRSLFQIISVMA